MKIAMYKVLAALLIGLILGIVASGLYYRHRLTTGLSDSILESSRDQIVEAANTLTLLQEQKYSQIINDKEDSLSSQVYALSFIPLPTDKKELRAYEIAARYCQKYPYKTGDSNIDQRVEDFLASVVTANVKGSKRVR